MSVVSKEIWKAFLFFHTSIFKKISVDQKAIRGLFGEKFPQKGKVFPPDLLRNISSLLKCPRRISQYSSYFKSFSVFRFQLFSQKVMKNKCNTIFKKLQVQWPSDSDVKLPMYTETTIMTIST